MFKPFAFGLIFVLTITNCGAQEAPPSDRASCTAFFDAITPLKADASQSVAVIPDALLSDSKRAIDCLVIVIGSLKPRVTSDVFEPDLRAKFMSATAALRSMIVKANAQDAANRDHTEIQKFVSEFRSKTNLDVVAVLTYGVRNQDPDVRLNSLLILANVIDNSTLCVPLDHLYIPDLEKTPHGKRGRANLLSVISVVAPWAYKENFKNIENARKSVALKTPNSDEFKDTIAILANIDARLKSQTGNSNMSVSSRDEGKACRQYKLLWAQPEQLSF
jgi:hypothetical protein